MKASLYQNLKGFYFIIIFSIVAIFRVSRACGCYELVNLKLDDIKNI